MWALATVGYTALLVFATHYPKPQDLVGAELPPDKLLHFVAYGGLGFLCAGTLAATGRWSFRNLLLLAAGLCLFAAVDEITQPLPWFRRSADPLDWASDCLGIVAGMAAAGILLAAVRRMAGPSAGR
jgi:VanZ family protein